MELPPDLRLALDQAAQSIPLRRLQSLATEISQRYRQQHGRTNAPLVCSADEVVAYASTRFPATWAAVAAALKAVSVRTSDWQPRSMLDVGAGPGTAVWAAVQTWPKLTSATLLEAEPAMIKLGRQLAQQARSQTIKQANWQNANLLTTTKLPQADLVTAAYVVGELSEAKLPEIIERLWAATNGACVIIEPGTPRGFARIRLIRQHLITLGATIIAPCPHAQTCPMPDDPEQNWCHFAERVARSKIHRSAKSADRGFEDEKYSYVAATRGLGNAAQARVLRHPLITAGKITLELCTRDGLKTEHITKRDQTWKQARKTSWGDSFGEE